LDVSTPYDPYGPGQQQPGGGTGGAEPTIVRPIRPNPPDPAQDPQQQWGPQGAYPSDPYQAGQYGPGQYGPGQYGPGQPPPGQYGAGPGAGQYGQGAYGQQAYQARPHAQGQYAQGPYAQGQYPQGQYAQAPYAQAQYPQGQYAQAPYAQGQYAQAPYARGQYAPGPYAPGAYPPGPYAPGSYGQGGFPAGQRPYLQGGPVDFGTATREAFRNMFAYQGRASRSAYWWFVLFQAIYFVVYLVLTIISVQISDIAVEILSFLALAGWIPVVLAQLSLFVRRMHDTNRSGWWFFLGLVPFGGFVLLAFTLSDGTPGPNQYG
jgi:uncharacterized membrane protein YhaH (DUF805 family)